MPALQPLAERKNKFFCITPFIFRKRCAIIVRQCRYSSSVERELPKLDRRVRLPLPAPEKALAKASAFFYPSRRLGISSAPVGLDIITAKPCISSRASVHFPADRGYTRLAPFLEYHAQRAGQRDGLHQPLEFAVFTGENGNQVRGFVGADQQLAIRRDVEITRRGTA